MTEGADHEAVSPIHYSPCDHCRHRLRGRAPRRQAHAQWFVRDLDIRTSLITRTIQEPLAVLVREGSRAKVLRYFERLIQDERLFAVGFCDTQRRLVYKTVTFPSSLTCTGRHNDPMEIEGRVVNLERGPVHVGDYDLEADGKTYGHLVLVHDMSFVQGQRRHQELHFLPVRALAVSSPGTVSVIAEMSWRGWVAG